jgi:hypothetical protein
MQRFVDAFKKRAHKTIPRAREGPTRAIIRLLCGYTLAHNIEQD